MINVELIVEEQPTLKLEVTEKIEQGGIIPSGTIPITSNGEYDVARYESADVDVPNTYTSEDEDKVVQNGQLVAQTPTRIDANGSYDTTTNDIVAVAVPNTYTAQDEGKVVNDGALVQQTSRNITQNDTYDTTLNDEVVVDVPNSYSATDEGKVVSNGALVGQTAREVTENGTYDTTLNNEVTVDVQPKDWVRPSEWPNLDLLHEDDYALYLTYDNTLPPTPVSLYVEPQGVVERVTINADGTVNVLDSLEVTGNPYSATFTIPTDAGDFPCYRVRRRNGVNIHRCMLNGNTFNRQKVLERRLNLPNVADIGSSVGYRGWTNRNVVADTIVNCSANINGQMTYRDSVRLCSLRVLTSNFKMSGNFWNCSMLTKIDPKIKGLRIAGNVFMSCGYLKEVDFSNIEITSATNSMGNLFRGDIGLEKVVLPSGDYSGITDTSFAFNGCKSLRGPLIFPSSFTPTIAQQFCGDAYNIGAVVLLAESVLALGNTSAFANNVYSDQTYIKVYVRQSLIEDYKVATNWSTLYNTNNDFLQPIEGSEFEYLLEE